MVGSTDKKDETTAMTNLWSNALGSAAAGIVGRIVTHPLDTVKAKWQAIISSSSQGVLNSSFKGPGDIFFKTVMNEGGVRALYRGFGTVVVAGTPGTILYLCSYDIIKERLQKAWGGDGQEQAFGIYFASGLMAESLACIVYVPVDVIKERLQVQDISAKQHGYYKNGLHALTTIAKTEGIFHGIYKGYGATLASFGPFSALYFLFYETAKSSLRSYHNLGHDKHQELPFASTVVASASSGALAAWCTSPLDLAKLRLQIQRRGATAGQKVPYKGFVDCLIQIYRIEGIRLGLFRGALARVVHFAPATAVTMTCYETCRSFFFRHLSSSKNNSLPDNR